MTSEELKQAAQQAISALQCAKRGHCDHAMADEAIAALEALTRGAAAQDADAVAVPRSLIRRAQQAINYHLEPDSPDEHERTMIELRSIGWPD